MMRYILKAFVDDHHRYYQTCVLLSNSDIRIFWHDDGNHAQPLNEDQKDILIPILEELGFTDVSEIKVSDEFTQSEYRIEYI